MKNKRRQFQKLMIDERKLWTAVFLLTLLSLAGCSHHTLRQEQLVNIPKMEWSHKFAPWLDLEIDDSTVLYNVFAVVRHTEAFKYSNLLLSYSLIRPGDSAVVKHINLPLADSHGAWLGDTLGTTIETRIRLNETPLRLGSGNNAFILAQQMPDEPLKGIVNIGIRLEAIAALSGAHLTDTINVR
ncbi:MAG TPA: gliding motility lipoprotein GldH [Arachidicoccus sp.]|nr:gliding motility lipoprotein GldH [Arachidicoccus sp.]